MNFPFPIAQLSSQPDWVRAGIMMGSFFLVAAVVGLLWNLTIARLAERSESSLDNLIFGALRGLVVWALVIGGIYSGVMEISGDRPQSSMFTFVTKALTVAWIVLVIHTLNRISKEYAKWKIAQVAEERGETRRDVATRVTFLRKVFSIVVFSVGALLVLPMTGVNTTPILTGGAVGGIVLGIALQDTLSNVFAGFFLNIDRPVKIGDLIKVEDKPEGFVEDIGWRYTRLRLKSNNLLIIPNNKLSQSMVMNIKGAARASSIDVAYKVPVASDLDEIAAAAQKIAEDVQSAGPDLRHDWAPTVRFSEYGETTVTMIVTLKAADEESLRKVKHEFILALHKRLSGGALSAPAQSTLTHVAISTKE